MKLSFGAAVLVFVLAPGAVPLEGQSAEFEPARLANGRPNLNGIWQALNSANYDLERHMARPAIGIGIHRDGADREPARRLDNAAGDFAAVGDQQ